MAHETQSDVSFTPASSSSALPIGYFSALATQVSPIVAPVSRELPLSIDKGQAYYWRYAWQEGEKETRAALAAGLGVTFSNAEDAIRWLLSGDDSPNGI